VKFTIHSKLGSILFSTFCVVAFGFLASPVTRPTSRVSGAIEVREATQAESSAPNLRVSAGKSVIMESSTRIIRASVENPDLARAVSIDDHELLVNGRTPGRTNVTVWQEGGMQRQFNLHVEGEQERFGVPAPDAKQSIDGHALTGAYQDAMARVQTAITGVKR
jgi:Flp pilus assembly secretin CpaC